MRFIILGLVLRILILGVVRLLVVVVVAGSVEVGDSAQSAGGVAVPQQVRDEVPLAGAGSVTRRQRGWSPWRRRPRPA